jgi:hypothetical protein
LINFYVYILQVEDAGLVGVVEKEGKVVQVRENLKMYG